jgi:dTDP-glucose 4,6-dehydratase
VTLCKGAPGRAYNVGSEDEVTIGDLAHRVARQAPPPVDVHVASLPPQFPRPDRYVPSTARAQDELGLRQLISLDEAIRPHASRRITPPEPDEQHRQRRGADSETVRTPGGS